MDGPRKIGRWDIKTWCLIILAIIVVVPVAKWIGRSAGEAAAQRDAVPKPPPFRAAASSQASEGVTDEMMDQNFLANLEAYTVERQVVNTRRALAARGITTNVPQPTSSSVYVMSGGRKFAVVRTEMEDAGSRIHSAFIMGIFSDEIRRVVCVSSEGEVSITFGPCADKIGETFGMRL